MFSIKSVSPAIVFLSFMLLQFPWIMKNDQITVIMFGQGILEIAFVFGNVQVVH